MSNLSLEQQQVWDALTKSPDWIFKELGARGVDVRRLQKKITNYYKRDTFKDSLAESLMVTCMYEGFSESAYDFCIENDLFTKNDAQFLKDLHTKLATTIK